MDKIPASIGILTLNSGKTLRACLESVKDFAEIVICDGNSTDDTLQIAREYGAKIVKQYDSDEPNLTCVADKANVRQKNMEAASYDWYFFMDSDDTLSPEVVAEIRVIVTPFSPPLDKGGNGGVNPEYLVWRMPTRIFIGEHEIKYASFYPSYQIRLFNRKINPRFRNQVHDRVIFDPKYAVGTLKNFYDYRWPEERVKNYWQFLKKYIDREVSTAGAPPLGRFILTEIIRPFKTAFGHLFYRLPKTYLRHGSKDTMPFKIEFYLLFWYSIVLIWALAKKRIRDIKPVIFFHEIIRKKDLERILVNIALKNKECFGKILDIGSGKMRASHYRFLKIIKWARIKTADVNAAEAPDFILNIERDPIPAPDSSYDFVLAFNLLEHLSKRENLLSETRRILKNNGKIIGSVPFLMDVHPDPHDFVRLTKEQLEIIFKDAGFTDIKIEAIGRGPFLAGYYQIDFLTPRILKLIIVPFVFLLDAAVKILKHGKNFRERYPLAYVFEARVDKKAHIS